jgi:hypothetical protein
MNDHVISQTHGGGLRGRTNRRVISLTDGRGLRGRGTQ